MRRALIAFSLLLLGAVQAQAAGVRPPVLPEALRAYLRPPSTYIDNRMLAAGVAETITAPTFAGFPAERVAGVFNGTCPNWWYSATGAATVPAADISDGGGSGRAPVILSMVQGDSISVVSDAACSLTTDWYLVP